MAARSQDPGPIGPAVFVAVAIAIVVGWQFPLGHQILYPFTILATFAHELGHGVAALLLGADFESLRLFADGSGLAHWRGDLGRFGRAFVAAGGLVGPSVVGAAFLVAARRFSARRVLTAMAILLALTLPVASGAFTWLFVGSGALLLLGAARGLPPRAQSLLVTLVSANLCLSVFRDLDYMFSSAGLVGGRMQVSDTGQIAEALWLPYWFFGALIAAFSFAVLLLGVRLAFPKRP